MPCRGDRSSILHASMRMLGKGIAYAFSMAIDVTSETL